jgi:hypothetical protein
VLLNELLKPSRIIGTPILGHHHGMNDTPDESVVKAAIAMMDEEVLGKVKAASDNQEALAILALNEDLRFGDLAECGALCDKLLGYIRPAIPPQPRERKRPGRHASLQRVEIRQHIEGRMEVYGRLLYEKRTKFRRKKRTEAAKQICMALYETDNLKLHPMIRIVLREDYPYKRRTKS